MNTEDGGKRECTPQNAEKEAKEPHEKRRQSHQVPEIDVAVFIEVEQAENRQSSVIRTQLSVAICIQKARLRRPLCASLRLCGVELVQDVALRCRSVLEAHT